MAPEPGIFGALAGLGRTMEKGWNYSRDIRKAGLYRRLGQVVARFGAALPVSLWFAPRSQSPGFPG
jgi:hypothetical protein